MQPASMGCYHTFKTINLIGRRDNEINHRLAELDGRFSSRKIKIMMANFHLITIIGHVLFSLLPSGGTYRSMKTTTFKNSNFSAAIRFLNKLTHQSYLNRTLRTISCINIVLFFYPIVFYADVIF